MYSTFFTVALFLVPAFAAFAVNQPDLTQCEDATISWAATENPPYNLIVVPAADPCGSTPFYELDTSKTKITWKPNVPAGTKVVLSVVDSGDEEVWSRNITVKGSSDKSCLAGASASIAPSSAGSAPSSSAEPSSSPSTVPNDPPAGEIVDPVGAANAGTNDLLNDSAAPSNSRLSQSVMALAAVGAVVALAL